MAMTGGERSAKWRQAGGDRVRRIESRAQTQAARWVRECHPEVWALLLSNAEQQEENR